MPPPSPNSNGNHDPPPPLPFWNTNLPPSEHTADCPPYLTYALSNAKDRAILATPDADYVPASWADARTLVRDGRLQDFARVPSQLHRYRACCAAAEDRWGSVMRFVLAERLGWGEGELEMDAAEEGEEEGGGRGGWFEREEDYKILRNDWPYGLDARIVHLVVWTKRAFPSAPVSAANPHGDLADDVRAAIDAFVARTFARACGADRVVWFWNWKELKSVLAVEHFHVLLFDPDPAFVAAVVSEDAGLGSRAEKRGALGE